jgi:hypothetical protein
MPWSRQFDLPVPGMRTLRDAADHIQKLPKAEQELPHWQFAVEMLIKASEHDAWIMLARMAMLKAMNHGKPGKPRELRRKRAKVFQIIL